MTVQPGLCLTWLEPKLLVFSCIISNRIFEEAVLYCQEIVKTGSELLNDKQRESWKSLNDTERQQSATAIIVSMETMALEVAATIDEPMTFASSEDNICESVYDSSTTLRFIILFLQKAN